MARDIENSEKSHLQWVLSARAKLDRFVAARLAPPPYLRWADARLAVLGGLHACEKTRPTTPNLGFGRASNGASYAAHAAKAPASRTLSGGKRNALNGVAPLSPSLDLQGCLRACSCQCSAASNIADAGFHGLSVVKDTGPRMSDKIFTMLPSDSCHQNVESLWWFRQRTESAQKKTAAPHQIEMSW